MSVFILSLSLLCLLATNGNAADKYQPSLDNALWYVQNQDTDSLQALIFQYYENKSSLFEKLNPTDKPTALLHVIKNNDIETAYLLFRNQLVDPNNLWNKTAYIWTLFLQNGPLQKLLAENGMYFLDTSTIIPPPPYAHTLITTDQSEPSIPFQKDTFFSACHTLSLRELETLIQSPAMKDLYFNEDELHRWVITSEICILLHKHKIITSETLKILDDQKENMMLTIFSITFILLILLLTVPHAPAQ